MRCPNCGCEVNKESGFCDNCGAPLKKEIAFEENAINEKEIEEKIAAELAQNDKFPQLEKELFEKSSSAKESVSNKKNEVKPGTKVSPKNKVKPGIKVSPKKAVGVFCVVAVIFMVIGIASLSYKRSISEKNVFANGSGMVAVSGVICNNEGAINYKFMGQEFDLYTDTDGKIGAFILENGKVYLVNSDLSETLIAEKAHEMCMNVTGEYIYIATDVDSEYGRGLLAYDVRNRELRLLKDDIYIVRLVASPDGKTVLYSSTLKVGMIELSGKETFVSGGGFHVYSVSNDRKVVFFADLEGDLRCWKDGQIIDIDTTEIWFVAVNSDCTKILYTDYSLEESFVCLNYFDSNTLEDKKDIKKHISDIYYKGKRLESLGTEYFPDEQSLDGVIIELNDDIFWLDKNMEPVHIAKHSDYRFYDGDFKLFLYDNDKISLASYESEECNIKEMCTVEGNLRDYAVSDDCKTLWIAYKDKLVMRKNGIEKTILTAEKEDFKRESLRNDPLTKDIYFIAPSGEFYKLDEETGAIFVTKLERGDRLYRGAYYEEVPNVVVIFSDDWKHMKYYVYGHVIKGK
ncbi:MAG: zinc ribbon domain-containing protein [Butyrivibrio sp.]|nr:zinc ribbon domain-containing protein [Butyrivibrio sp.]